MRSETDYDLDYDLRRLWREAKQTLERMPEEEEEEEGCRSASGVNSVAHQALARARQMKQKGAPSRTAGSPFMRQKWSRPLPAPAPDGSSPSSCSRYRNHGFGNGAEENGALNESTEGALLNNSFGAAGGISRLNEMLTSSDQDAAVDRTRFNL